MPTQAQRLIYAVRTRNYGRLRDLLGKEGAATARSRAGRTALHAAAEEGDFEAARTLVDAGADSNARTLDEQTPLQMAASYGGFFAPMDPDLDRRDHGNRNRHRPISDEACHVVGEILQQRNPQVASEMGVPDDVPKEHRDLIFSGMLGSWGNLFSDFAARGIDIDRLDPNCAEMLRGNPRFLKVARLLLEHGAAVNTLDKAGGSPLSGAVEHGSSEMVELLIEHGADLYLRPAKSTEESENPSEKLIESALDRLKFEIAEILHARGAKLPAHRLHYAAAYGQKKVMLWLIDKGLDINHRNERGNTPLLDAPGHEENVAALLERGADFKAVNHNGESILHTCAPWPKCLDLVLPLGLPVNQTSQSGQTPLHSAAQSCSWESVQNLLHAGALPNVQDENGNTPLHFIFDSGEQRPDLEFLIFLSLIEGGADRTITNREGKTAFDRAKESNYPDEYLQLLNPDRSNQPERFISLHNEPYADFLPKAKTPVELDGKLWPTSEHYFHARKAPVELREHIRSATELEDALTRLREADFAPLIYWMHLCDSIMRQALLAKFRQHENLRAMLLATKDAVLVSDANCESYWMENRFAGFNAIGKMLMSIRSELQMRTDDDCPRRRLEPSHNDT